MMKVGLLQCDDVREDLRAVHGNYPEMFERPLRARLPDMDYRVYRAHDGELPSSVDSCDVYLTTGSKFGVYDGLPWIDALQTFVLQLWTAGKPLVGICFGHQLMARTLGGQVLKSPKGWGVGMSFNDVLVHKQWMKPATSALDLIVSHQDQVVQLPPQAEVLASSDFCPYYLLQYGEHFLSVQGHPEFCKAYSADLMTAREASIPPTRLRAGRASLAAEVDDQVMLDWIVSFLQYAR
ncbi:glutamine amidotransferase-related protein [Halopseudomonas sabulinigri]|uniref:GMP synthase n=1 Tax=Halopseudomonas sabulinigri TaxID=472181 RepID=A0ABP9ZKA5_9GAMM